jgi:hypothetical protein
MSLFKLGSALIVLLSLLADNSFAQRVTPPNPPHPMDPPGGLPGHTLPSSPSPASPSTGPNIILPELSRPEIQSPPAVEPPSKVDEKPK